jgi:hypothetical protein
MLQHTTVSTYFTQHNYCKFECDSWNIWHCQVLLCSRANSLLTEKVLYSGDFVWDPGVSLAEKQ